MLPAQSLYRARRARMGLVAHKRGESAIRPWLSTPVGCSTSGLSARESLRAGVRLCSRSSVGFVPIWLAAVRDRMG